jgi:hypothetical protein
MLRASFWSAPGAPSVTGMRTPDTEGVIQEAKVQHACHHAIDPAAKPGYQRRHRDRGQHNCIDQHLQRVAFAPCVTGSIGTPAFSYSECASRLRAQKCGGVQKKVMANRIHASSGVLPVTAAQPITGGKAPAPPPITMFCGVERFSHIV